MAWCDVTGGNCLIGEIATDVSVLFCAQNKSVNNSFVDFCGGSNVFHNGSL